MGRRSVAAPCALRAITPVFARVSPRTVWTFLRVEADHGLSGLGEATLPGQEAALADEVAAITPTILGRSADPGDLPAAMVGGDLSLPRAAVISALDQALWDIAGQRAGQPVHELLGPARRQSIALYANVNRRTIDRRPESFAESARLAVAAGHTAVKIAPFDGLAPGRVDQQSRCKLVDAGLARIAAVREVIGPDRRLLVDCHWRFDEASAATTLRAASSLELYWFECPLAETLASLPALRRLRSIANERGVRLAGAEQMSLLSGFAPFLDAGAYDVMMPDVKYAGGLQEMLRIAERFAERGVAFSPHNPTGPVCHAASLHVSASAESFLMLEIQFDESPMFWTIASGDLPRPERGASRLPQGPGLGLRLESDHLPPLKSKDDGNDAR